MFTSEPMDEKIIATDRAIPGWVDYVRSQADNIEASFADRKEGLSASGLYIGAAESIRQAAAHDLGDESGSLFIVSRVLQSGSVTTDQLRDLWHAAQGNREELNRFLDRLVSLGEIEV